jgi:hypothetical protein
MRRTPAANRQHQGRMGDEAALLSTARGTETGHIITSTFRAMVKLLDARDWFVQTGLSRCRARERVCIQGETKVRDRYQEVPRATNNRGLVDPTSTPDRGVLLRARFGAWTCADWRPAYPGS